MQMYIWPWLYLLRMWAVKIFENQMKVMSAIAISQFRGICPQARTNCEPSSGFYMEILSDFFVISEEVVAAAVAAGWTSATKLYMGDMNKWTRACCVFSH